MEVTWFAVSHFISVCLLVGLSSAARITSRPKNVTVSPGQDAVLRCGVDNPGNDVIEWYMRDTWRGGIFQWVTIFDSLTGEIHEERDQFWHKDFRVERDFSLRVSRDFIRNFLRKPDDLAPQFACKLLSEGVFHMASINVKAPRISKSSPANVYFSSGKDAVIRCEVTGVNSPEDDILVWYEFISDPQMGQMIFNSKQNSVVHPNKDKYQVVGKYNLLIKSFSLEDEGEYGCKLVRDNTFYVTSAHDDNSDNVVTKPTKG